LKRFLVDSGFILALYKNEGDQSTRVRETFQTIVSIAANVLVIPWPVLYERFNTEFARKSEWIGRFDQEWSNLQRLQKLEYIDDSPFRLKCKDEL
jgi:hypothetical protein